MAFGWVDTIDAGKQEPKCGPTDVSLDVRGHVWTRHVTFWLQLSYVTCLHHSLTSNIRSGTLPLLKQAHTLGFNPHASAADKQAYISMHVNLEAHLMQGTKIHELLKSSSFPYRTSAGGPSRS